jgi:chemotaxis protein MotB
LRIELLETAAGAFFESGDAQPTSGGQELLVKLAEELGKLPNQVSIEGHTDAKPFARGGAYGNWELSTERGNAARRLMQASGLGPKQVTQVRGFADQRLRKPNAPEDPSNRRISVIVLYQTGEGAGGAAAGGAAPAAGGAAATPPKQEAAPVKAAEHK